jgi:polysaccharide export outer membrane protein
VISVEGAVKNPQAVPVFGRTTLRSVLDQCGGLAEDAGSTITVTRGTARTGGVGDGDSEGGAIHVDAKRLRDTSDPVSRFEVWPGDRVSVEHAGLFYVLGEVSRPGGYNLKTAQERVTVLEALAIAGDFTSVAKRDKARIIRKDPKAPDGLLEVALNVKAIIAGHSPDPVLQTNDILYVPGSGPRKVARTFTQSAVAIASGAGSVALYGR